MSSKNPLHDFFTALHSKNERLRVLDDRLEEANELPYQEALGVREELIAQRSALQFESTLSSEKQREELREFLFSTIGPLLGRLGRLAHLATVARGKNRPVDRRSGSRARRPRGGCCLGDAFCRHRGDAGGQCGRPVLP